MDSSGPYWLASLKLRRCLLMVCSLIVLQMPSVTSTYSIGVGIADVTGPIAEVVFVSLILSSFYSIDIDNIVKKNSLFYFIFLKMGYAKMDQKGSGLHLRTFARSFIIDDGKQRFVFVSVDSAMIGHGVKFEVYTFFFQLKFVIIF